MKRIVRCEIVEQAEESSGVTAIWTVDSAKIGLEVSEGCSQGGLGRSAFHFGELLFQELLERVEIIVNVRGHDDVGESNKGERRVEKIFSYGAKCRENCF